MSHVASPGDPAARPGSLGTASRALAAAGAGGAAAFLWVAIACELLGALGYLATSTRDLVSWAKIGLVAIVLSVRAPVDVRLAGIPGVTDRADAGPIAVSVVFVPMLVTLAFVWLAARAGRRAADERPEGSAALTVLVVAAGSAVPVAVLAGLSAAAANVSLPLVSAKVTGEPSAAAAWGAGLSAIAAGAGGALRATRSRPLAQAVRGGITAYGSALLVLVVGVVVIAAVEPGATRSYVRLLADAGPLGPVAFGVHVLALPAQSALLIAPASGACLDVVAGGPLVSLCPWRLEPVTPGTWLISRTTPLSPWLWLLSVVPALAAFLGGVRAALGVLGRRRTVGLGGIAGAVFGILALAGAWFASPSVEGIAPALVPFTIRAEPVATIVGTVASGVLGGIVGGWLEGRRYADEPVPPRRTSA